MALKASEISQLIKERIENFEATSEARDVGTVIAVTDGAVTLSVDIVRAAFEDAYRRAYNRLLEVHGATGATTDPAAVGENLSRLAQVAAHHPSRIRSLFTGDDFTEGWASFVEQMTLDHGFDDDRPLTRMAHLRKRLENAIRAYVSVQVHCRN